MTKPISYRLLLEHVNAAILHLTQELKIRYVNPAAEILLTKSLSRLKGKRLDQVCERECGIREMLHASMETGQVLSRRELDLQLPSGKQSVVHMTVTPLPEQQGVLIEINPIERLYSITQESVRVEEVNTTRNLLRGLAHEIKNPLGGIRGAAQLLEGELNDPELHAYTHIIIHETDRLRRLLDQMTGPRTPMKLEPLNIHEVTERVCRLLHNEAPTHIKIVRDYDPSIPEFDADKDKLIQAVLNVAQNALEAVEDMPDGTVILSTRVRLNYTLNEHRFPLVILIRISDNGPGIKDELQGQIFYPMVTDKPSGTGLGLSVAQSIIAAHGGLIKFESAPGSTDFEILIPTTPYDTKQ